jgi:uncharacterized Zn finger protein
MEGKEMSTSFTQTFEIKRGTDSVYRCKECGGLIESANHKFLDTKILITMPSYSSTSCREIVIHKSESPHA